MLCPTTAAESLVFINVWMHCIRSQCRCSSVSVAWSNSCRTMTSHAATLSTVLGSIIIVIIINYKF